MRVRIGVLAIAGVGLVTAVVIGAMSMLILRAHRDALVAQLTRSADRLSETIGRSTYYDMLENRRDAVHREILTIGAQQGIEKVRLFNATGTIMFSSDEAEVGSSVDRRAEACWSCHAADQPLQKLSTRERSRVYAAADGHRVLGMIRPIHNEAACWNAACHAHSRASSVLGVLDVNLSMREVDLQLARDQRRLWLLAVLAIAAGSLLLWWLTDRLVLRPVAVLTAATRRVAEGDLRITLPATARHELGDLARAFNDMTRRLGEAQRQLTQADKLASVGRLAAGVAHEINNPLTGVLTYASVLHKRSDHDPQLRSDLEVIVRETKRCREIVRGLLDFARPSPPKRQPTDLNEVVRRAVAVVMNQLALRHVSLDLDLASDLEPLPADGNQIQQVVVNLLLNAVDAIGDQGGTIRLASRALPSPAGAGCAEVTVEDSGQGIAPEHMDHLFEPFFSTKGNHGTGLGLAVTWGIVEAHGGTIDVRSEPGRGARFIVRLPYGAADAPERGAA
jgi:two-component system NtrC family sensor kinase